MTDAGSAAKIREWSENNSHHVVELTERLIRIPSVNHVPNGDEAGVQAVVAEYLTDLGAAVDQFEPGAVPGVIGHPAVEPGRDFTGRPNVVGTWRGAGSNRSLLFSSHADVVLGLAGRFQPFEPVREGDRLYGRGSSDMKGGLAATLVAARCLRELGLRLGGDLIVESVVDEEMGGSNGTLAARLRGYNADAAIVPEPTGMRIAPAHRGGGFYRLTLRGKPGMGFSANELLQPAAGLGHLLVALEEWERERRRIVPPAPFDPADRLPVVVSTVHAGDFEPGTGNGVPSTGWLEVWAEVFPGTTEEDLLGELLNLVAAAAARAPVLRRLELTWQRGHRFLPPSAIPVGHPIVSTLVEATSSAGRPLPVRGAPFACDVFIFNQHSPTPAVLLGPRGGNAHAPDEWVDVRDLVDLVTIFALTAARWCGLQ